MKVYISDGFEFDGLRIFITTEESGKILLAKPVELVFEKVNPCEFNDPTLKVSGYVANDFLQAFQDALSKRGIKTDNDHKLQGTLEATKYHLEDLRKIVFKSI